MPLGKLSKPQIAKGFEVLAMNHSAFPDDTDVVKTVD